MKNKILLFVILTFVVFNSAISVFAQDNPVYTFDYDADRIPCNLSGSQSVTSEALENLRILGDITDSDWSIGPKEAPLTIIEYSDFQCPYCANASISLIKYQQEHPEDVRLVYRHFPLSFHEKAVLAATAVNAAGDQGMFFDAAEYLFEHQNEWSGLGDNNVFTTWLIEKFNQFSDLDFEKWYLAFTDNDRIQEVQNTYNQVVETGIIGGTPTVFVNFVQTNDISAEALNKQLQEVKLREIGYNHCPGVVIEEGVEYQAVLETEVGDIHVDLFADTAPIAVNNFKFLSESGWYKNNDILKKQDGFMLQSGDPTNTMYGHPGYYFPTEYNEAHKFNEPGTLGMANSGRNKNGSQFFITYDLLDYYTERIKEDSEKLDIDEDKINDYVEEKMQKFSKAYTAFGKVVEEDLPLLDQLEQGMVIHNITVTAK